MASDNQKRPKRRRPLLEGFALALWVFSLSVCGFGAAVLLHTLTLGLSVVFHCLLLSVLSFILFAWDKSKAKREKRRISEANLITLSVLGGALGGLAAMLIFHHKGRHLVFRVMLPVSLFFQCVLIFIAFFSGT